jgi:hypothetical protein
MNPNDDLLARLQVLRELPAGEPPRELAERVARRAHAELAQYASERTALGWVTLAWTRVGLPVALFVTVVGYLFCAFQSASAHLH